MITLYHVHYEIHDEVSKNDKAHNGLIKVFSAQLQMKKLINCFG